MKLGLYTFVILIFSSICLADVKSTDGQIRFDSNSDSTPELTLDEIGLKIGTGTASANLEVDGNVLITESIVIGSSSLGNSNIQIQGSQAINFAPSVTSNVTLDGNYSLHLIDSSAQGLDLVLPTANTMNGRIMMLKQINASNNVTIRHSSLIDNLPTISFQPSSGSPYPFMKLISSGNQWYVLESGGGASTSLDYFYEFNNSLADWNETGGGTWVVSNGEIVQTGNSVDAKILYQGSGSSTWSDYTVRFSFYSGDDDYLSVHFYAQDDNNFYSFDINQNLSTGGDRPEVATAPPFRRVRKVVGGVDTVLDIDAFAFLSNQVYDVEIEVNSGGNTIVRWAEDGDDLDEIFNISTPADFSSGTIGFKSIYLQGVYIQNLKLDTH